MEEQEQLAAARMTVALSGSAMGTSFASATLRTRTNFAVQHMLAAARFARMSGDVEADHAGEPSDPFFEEIISYVSATVLTSGAGLEAYINELFIDADVFFSEYRQGTSGDLWDILWTEVERRPTLEKYELALDLKKQARFAKEDKSSSLFSAYKSACILIEVRNSLIHFKPQWDDEEKSHQHIAAQLLRENVQTSPFTGSTPIFPTEFMSHDMAKWAVKTSWQFTEAFSQKSGLKNKYAEVIDRLNPGYPTWPLGIG